MHAFWLTLIDNDTRVLFSILYDGDFGAYLTDLKENTTEWFDPVIVGTVEGFNGLKDASINEWLAKNSLTADFFYTSHPDVSVRDIKKMKTVSKAVSDLLDAAS